TLFYKIQIARWEEDGIKTKSLNKKSSYDLMAAVVEVEEEEEEEMSQSTVCFESLKKEVLSVRMNWGCSELSTRAVVYFCPYLRMMQWSCTLWHILFVGYPSTLLTWLTPSLMDVRIFVKVLAWRWRWLWLAATKADTRFFKNLCSKRKEWAVIRIDGLLTLDKRSNMKSKSSHNCGLRKVTSLGLQVDLENFGWKVKRKEFKPADRENGGNVNRSRKHSNECRFPVAYGIKRKKQRAT
ncbi:hypothetical protein Tco_1269093, partial [Tanacetum coccineum]